MLTQRLDVKRNNFLFNDMKNRFLGNKRFSRLNLIVSSMVMLKNSIKTRLYYNATSSAKIYFKRVEKKKIIIIKKYTIEKYFTHCNHSLDCFCWTIPWACGIPSRGKFSNRNPAYTRKTVKKRKEKTPMARYLLITRRLMTMQIINIIFELDLPVAAHML